jgi:hypothetical protein
LELLARVEERENIESKGGLIEHLGHFQAKQHATLIRK